MRWADAHFVEGSQPPTTIARPMKKDPKTGAFKKLKFYHARFTQRGRTVSRSLGTSNKQQAIRGVLHGQIAPEKTAMNEAPSAGLTIGSAIDEYLKVCADRDLSDRTRQKYDNAIRDLKEFLDARADAPVATFGEKEFWAFSSYLRGEKNNAEKTAYDKLTIIRQCFRFLVRGKYLASYPLEGVRLRKPEWNEQPCFNPTQIKALLANADDYLRPIFAVMAYCGLRFGEVRDLQWRDVRLDDDANKFLWIQRGGSGNRPKDRESRRIPLHPKLQTILSNLPRHGDCLFHCRPCNRYPKGDGPLNERTVLADLKRLCDKCGFVNPDQYKLHTFRHAFASTCAAAGVPYRYVLAWLGHSSSQILDLYVSIHDDVAQETMVAINFAKQD